MYRVVIAEDETLIRQGIETLIPWNSLGCEIVCSSSNGADALSYVENNPVDIVVTDIQMAVMDGLELSRRIDEEYPLVKVIILTSHAKFDYAQQSIRYGVVDFIMKADFLTQLPLSIEKVKKRIQEENARQKIAPADVQQMLFKNIQAKAGYLMAELTDVYYVLCCEVVDEEQLQGESASLLEIFKLSFEQNHVYTLQTSEEVFLTILNRFPGESAVTSLVRQCNNLCYMVEKLTGRSIVIGVSLPHIGAETLDEAQYQAVEALSNIFENTTIAFYQEASDLPSSNIPNINAMISELINHLVYENDLSSSLVLVSDIFQEFYRCGATIAEVQANALLLCYAVNRLLAENESILQKSNQSISFHMEQARSYKRLFKLVQSFIKDASKSIKDNQLSKNKIVRDIDSYILNHYRQQINLDKIASDLHVSKSYLCRVYKKERKISIIDALNRHRVYVAKHFLKTTDKKILDVANEVGFDSSSYFSTVFSKYEGVSPKEYKLNH